MFVADNFTPEPKIQQIAEAYALDAIDFARDHFQLALDRSDASVAHIETILGVFHVQLADAKPSEEQIFTFAKMFGSYVGEVFRSNHGATWGLIGGDKIAGLKFNGGGGLFWPWGRAQKRIINGPEDNVWHYYQWLVEKRTGSVPPTPRAVPARKKSWWERLRRG
jgi:hypothetical protein